MQTLTAPAYRAPQLSSRRAAPEIVHLITWRTSGRMLWFTKRRLRYFFVEEWVRFFFLTVPFIAAPTVIALANTKKPSVFSLVALLTPFAVTSAVAAVLALKNVLAALRFIDSQYELNDEGLQLTNKARRQFVAWDAVRKWTLDPHPYAHGLKLLTFYFIEPAGVHRSRHIAMEVDPIDLDLAQIEDFVLNRVGFRPAGFVPIYEPI